MAKKPIENEEEVVDEQPIVRTAEEPEEEDEEITLDDLTTAVKKKDDSYKGPRVSVFLPALEESGEAGVKVDQYEHVTISNEKGSKTYYVRRGEHVDVPVPVFLVLKERYPKL